MHWGSEHAVEGHRYSGELQLVHYRKRYGGLGEAAGHAGGIAVVAVMLREDNESPNSEVEKIAEVLPSIELKGEQTQTAEVVRVEELLPEDRDYLTYHGSLTSPAGPGLEEGVLWAVLTSPVGVSSRALARMTQLRHGGPGSARMVANNRCEPPAATAVSARTLASTSTSAYTTSPASQDGGRAGWQERVQAG